MLMLSKQPIGFLVLGSICALVLDLASGPAHASATLTVSDGIHSTTVLDDGSGEIDFLGKAAGWNSPSDWRVTLTGLTKGSLGTAQSPDLHLTVLGNGVGNLSLSFADDGFIGNGLTGFLTQTGGVVGAGGSITLGATSTAGSLASFDPWGSGPFSSEQYTEQTLNGSYGLELFASIVHTQSDASSFDASVQVPEPPAFTLLGAGLLGGALVLRWRRANERLRPVRC
jgi:PEP-CTERM motif-containing protein